MPVVVVATGTGPLAVELELQVEPKSHPSCGRDKLYKQTNKQSIHVYWPGAVRILQIRVTHSATGSALAHTHTRTQVIKGTELHTRTQVIKGTELPGQTVP